MDLTPYDDPEDAVSVAFRLTRRRLRLSQRELAEVLGWDASAVGRWESGHVSKALGRVDGVLRGMGFRLAVVVVDLDEWADVDEPVEHIADRGLRRLPAHVDHQVVLHPPLHWWLRYRDKPNPLAPNWTYGMRPQDRRAAPRAPVASGPDGGGQVHGNGDGGGGDGDEARLVWSFWRDCDEGEHVSEGEGEGEGETEAVSEGESEGPPEPVDGAASPSGDHGEGPRSGTPGEGPRSGTPGEGKGSGIHGAA